MKRISRFLAILLIFALLIPCFCITGLADEKIETDETLTHYVSGTGYLAFGDSVARGYALPNFQDEGYTIDNTNNHNCRIVHGSYPYIIAQTLGCKTPEDMTIQDATYWPIAQDALTSSFICDLLGIDDGYWDEVYLHDYDSMLRRYVADLYYFGDPESFSAEDGVSKYGKTGCAYSVRDLVAESSLITIGIGMSDILNRARSLAFDPFFNNGGDLTDIAAVVAALKDFVSKMYEGYQRWENNFPLILDYFKQNIREGATVVIVGAFNPMFGITITEDIPVPIGTVLTALTNLMNQKYRQWAHQYGFTFVDVSNVDTGSSETPTTVMDFITNKDNCQGAATHPTPDGYRQMARMVLNALREKDAKEPGCGTEKTTVKVDLGTLYDKTVNYVAVDKSKLEDVDYQLEDYILTVPQVSRCARLLTVAADNDGKIPMSMYLLSYDRTDGYVPLRLYSTSDASPMINAITGAISSVKNIIGKLMP